MEQEPLDNYEFKDFIANGAFGSVFLAHRKSDKKACAIKVFEKIKVGNTDKIYEEARILSSLNHPNIVKFEEILGNNKKIFIVMEYIPGGNLGNLIRDRRRSNSSLTDEERSKIIRHTTDAVLYLHKHGIIHRDIKLENIVLADKKDFSTVKLIDFGLSAEFSNEMKTFNKNCGTLLYLAPELFKYNIYTKAVDVWACGILLYMVCNEGRHPFYVKEESKEEFIKKLKNPPREIPHDLDELPKSLYLKMTASEPSERYTIEQVCSHPWLTRNFHSSVPLTSAENFIAFQQQSSLLRVIKALMFVSYCEGPKDKRIIKKMKTIEKFNTSFFYENCEESKSIEDIEGQMQSIAFDSVSDLKKSTDYTSTYSHKTMNYFRPSDNSGEYMSRNNSTHQDTCVEFTEKYKRSLIKIKNEREDSQKKKEFRISPLKKVSTFGPGSSIEGSPMKKLYSKRTFDLHSDGPVDRLNQEENHSPERNLVLPKINNPRSPRKLPSLAQNNMSPLKSQIQSIGSNIFNMTTNSGFGNSNPSIQTYFNQTGQISSSHRVLFNLNTGEKGGHTELSPLKIKRKQHSTYEKKTFINPEENLEISLNNTNCSIISGLNRNENIGIQNNSNIIDLQLYLKNLGIKVGSKNFSNVSEKQRNHCRLQDFGLNQEARTPAKNLKIELPAKKEERLRFKRKNDSCISLNKIGNNNNDNT